MRYSLLLIALTTLTIATITTPAEVNAQGALSHEVATLTSEVSRLFPKGSKGTQLTGDALQQATHLRGLLSQQTRKSALSAIGKTGVKNFDELLERIAVKRGMKPGSGKELLVELVPNAEARTALLKSNDAPVFFFRHALSSGAFDSIPAQSIDDLSFLLRSKALAGEITKEEAALLTEMVTMQRTGAMIMKDGVYIAKAKGPSALGTTPTAETLAAVNSKAHASPPKPTPPSSSSSSLTPPSKPATAAAPPATPSTVKRPVGLAEHSTEVVAGALKLTEAEAESCAKSLLSKRARDAATDAQYWAAEAKKARALSGELAEAKAVWAEQQRDAAVALKKRLEAASPSEAIAEARKQTRVVVNPSPTKKDLDAALEAMSVERRELTQKLELRKTQLRVMQSNNFENIVRSRQGFISTRTVNGVKPSAAEIQAFEATIEQAQNIAPTVKEIAELELNIAQLQTITPTQYAMLRPTL